MRDFLEKTCAKEFNPTIVTNYYEINIYLGLYPKLLGFTNRYSEFLWVKGGKSGKNLVYIRFNY